MNEITVRSPANIAFIKFWGKKDPRLNIPFNDSISMNLSGCTTETTVEFDPSLKEDIISVDGNEVAGLGRDRVVVILDEVRKAAKVKLNARVTSKNSFPSDAGIASSASGFSALALAASKAAALNLGQRQLSILARRGSGSACRSIPDGFTYWKKGKDNGSSYAFSLVPPEFWDIRDLVVVVSKEKKKAGSTEGHSVAATSPYFESRLKKLPERIKVLKGAILRKDFDTFGATLEEETVDLHVMAMTSRPPIFYWNAGTMEVMHKVMELRVRGIKCFFTIDAGPNVHVICLGKDENRIKKELGRIKEVLFIIPNKAAGGARII